MGIESLTEIELIHFITILIFVMVCIVIAIKIITKTITYKRIEFITIGLSWIFITSIWWAKLISITLFITTGQILNQFQFLLIAHSLIPIGLILWIYSFCTMMYPHQMKKIVPIYTIIVIIYEILLFVFLIINPNFIGVMVDRFNSDDGLFVSLFLLFGVLTFLITGLIFANKSLRSDNKKNQWKGLFLIIAFISFTIAAIINILVTETLASIIIVRGLFILSAITYYLGFFLPDRLAAILIKEE